MIPKIFDPTMGSTTQHLLKYKSIQDSFFIETQNLQWQYTRTRFNVSNHGRFVFQVLWFWFKKQQPWHINSSRIDTSFVNGAMLVDVTWYNIVQKNRIGTSVSFINERLSKCWPHQVTSVHISIGAILGSGIGQTGSRSNNSFL